MAKKQKYSIDELKEAMKKKQAFEAYIEDVDGEYNLHCVFASDIKVDDSFENERVMPLQMDVTSDFSIKRA